MIHKLVSRMVAHAYIHHYLSLFDHPDDYTLTRLVHGAAAGRAC